MNCCQRIDITTLACLGRGAFRYPASTVTYLDDAGLGSSTVQDDPLDALGFLTPNILPPVICRLRLPRTRGAEFAASALPEEPRPTS